jgi:hypothetical protein
MSDAQSFVEGWSRVWRGRDSDPELYMELLREGCPLINRSARLGVKTCSELFYAPWDPGRDPRHVGTLEPVWNLFDLIREGRPAEFDEQLSYE